MSSFKVKMELNGIYFLTVKKLSFNNATGR